MIYLLQVLHLLDAEQIDLFEDLFEDLADVLELGYSELEACEVLLNNHFGLTIRNDFQLASFAEKVQDKKLLTAAINTVKLQRAG